MAKKKVGALISGNGSNLQALIDACRQPEFPAEITVVISNKEDAYGLNRAREAGIHCHIVSHKDYATREAFDESVHYLLERHSVEIVCLAGFMRILSPWFIGKWRGRLLNIHPSLLPQFKGMKAVAQALAAGVKETGCTVHLVTDEMDSGPVLMQARVPVFPGDTEETLLKRINEQEHRIYPAALRALAEKF